MSMVECLLCPRHCRLENGERGDCRVRVNLDGKLQTLVYGKPCSVHIDPIEKKPLFHVLPGAGTFSIATAGCNLHCKYCQNWEISQSRPEDTANIDLPPQAVVENARRNNCAAIAYTYSDPIICYEYLLDTAKAAREQKILNLMITAGFIEQEPLLELCSVVDAIKIDFKGITEEFYQKMCDGSLAPVLRAIETIARRGVWLELVNLVVPTWNDDPKDIRALCRWVYEHLGPDVPLHFSRFWPQHQLRNLPPTPYATLLACGQIAREEKIHYVYIGNTPEDNGNNTLCPRDGKLLVRRIGFRVLENHLVDGRCPECREKIPGIWQ